MTSTNVQFIPSICCACGEPTLYDSPADPFSVCTSCARVLIFGQKLRCYSLIDWPLVAKAHGYVYGGEV